MKGKELIPTSLRRDINKYGNSRFADTLTAEPLRHPLDNRIYVVAKRKAVEVYLSDTGEYLGNLYFRGNYFVFTKHLNDRLYKLSKLKGWELDISLCRFLRRMVDKFIIRG